MCSTLNSQVEGEQTSGIYTNAICIQVTTKFTLNKCKRLQKQVHLAKKDQAGPLIFLLSIIAGAKRES